MGNPRDCDTTIRWGYLGLDAKPLVIVDVPIEMTILVWALSEDFIIHDQNITNW